MRTWLCFFAVAAILSLGCNSNPTGGAAPSLAPERTALIEKDVRAYMNTVAHDVTQEGPAAWNRHLGDGPSFFMASEGRLVFPNSAAAKTAIQELIQTIKHIELTWGDDLRVDPLTPEFAAVGATFHETLDLATGKRLETTGFFTAIAEHKGEHWQFRNAHWSEANPASGAP